MAKTPPKPKPPRRQAPIGSHVSNRTGQVVDNRGKQGKPAVRPGPQVGAPPGRFPSPGLPYQPGPGGPPRPGTGTIDIPWGPPPPGGWYQPPGAENPVPGLNPPQSTPPTTPGVRPPISSGFYGDLTTQGPRKPNAATTTTATTPPANTRPPRTVGKRGNERSAEWIEKHPSGPVAARAAKATAPGTPLKPFTPTGGFGQDRFTDFFQNKLWEGGDLESIPEQFMADNPGFVEGLFGENFWDWLSKGGAGYSDPTSVIPMSPAIAKKYKELGLDPNNPLTAYSTGQLGEFIPGVTAKNPQNYYNRLAGQSAGNFALNNIFNTPEYLEWAMKTGQGLEAVRTTGSGGTVNPSALHQLATGNYQDFGKWAASAGYGDELAQYLMGGAGDVSPYDLSYWQGAPGYNDWQIANIQAMGPQDTKGKLHGSSPGDPTKADIYHGYQEGTISPNKVGTQESEQPAQPKTNPYPLTGGNIPTNLSQPSMAPVQGYLPDYYYGGSPMQNVPPPITPSAPVGANEGFLSTYTDAGTNPQNKFEDFMAMMNQWEQPTETTPASFPVAKRSRARKPRGKRGKNDRGRR